MDKVDFWVFIESVKVELTSYFVVNPGLFTSVCSENLLYRAFVMAVYNTEFFMVVKILFLASQRLGEMDYSG